MANDSDGRDDGFNDRAERRRLLAGAFDALATVVRQGKCTEGANQGGVDASNPLETIGESEAAGVRVPLLAPPEGAQNPSGSSGEGAALPPEKCTEGAVQPCARLGCYIDVLGRLVCNGQTECPRTRALRVPVERKHAAAEVYPSKNGVLLLVIGGCIHPLYDAEARAVATLLAAQPEITTGPGAAQAATSAPDVACPVCNAPAGQWCDYLGAPTPGQEHTARRLLALRPLLPAPCACEEAQSFRALNRSGALDRTALEASALPVCPKCGAPSRPSGRLPGLVCTSTMCRLLFRPRTAPPALPRGRQLLQRVALNIQDAREEAESVEGGIARLYVGRGIELADQILAWSDEREGSADPIGHYCPKCGAAFEVYAKPGERVLLCGSCGWVEGSGPQSAALVQEFVPVSRNLVMATIAHALTEARELGRKYADASGTPSIAAECGYLRAALRSLVVRLRDGGAL